MERGLSENTVLAYDRDLDKLFAYFDQRGIEPVHATLEQLREFIQTTFSVATNSRTQARVVAGLGRSTAFCCIITTWSKTPPNCWRVRVRNCIYPRC